MAYLNLEIDTALHDALIHCAKTNNRSLKREAIRILESALLGQKPTTDERIDDLEQRVAGLEAAMATKGKRK